jgi:AcrR family transcriptional regulator
MKKLGVRERIIETASVLFYSQGYNQTGINQIIEEAGVAKASMYHHFRSKEDIAVDYLIGRHTMWMNKLTQFVSVQNTAKGKIIGCFDYLSEWLTEVDFRGCGWQNIITDLPTDHDKIRSQAIYHKNQVREWIHTLLNEESQFTKEESEDLRDQVLVLLEGAIILSQIQKDSWPINSAKKACIKLLA